MSRATATAVVFAGLLLALLVLLWAFQRRLMYFPFDDVPAPEAVGLPDASPVTFQTADGLVLRGWFVPSRQSPARLTIVVFNGNAGNRAFRGPLAAALGSLGLQVLLFDYRGYGGNPGTPTEEGLAADAQAALAYVRGRADVDPARIGYFGESLGTGVAVTLAAVHSPAVLVLRSPFTSMTDVGRLHYPWLPVGSFLRDRYDSLERLRRITCPVLVIAGDRDGIIPVEQSRRMFDAAPGKKSLLIVPGADHNDDALLAGRDMIDAIDRFLAQSGY
jgi:uncharacterized protein